MNGVRALHLTDIKCKALTSQGFLLMEALIVILILAVAFTAFMGVMAQALRVSSKARQMTEAVSEYEAFLFELESGMRPDLVLFGGGGELAGGYQYEIHSETLKEPFVFLKTRLFWKEGKESLGLELTVPEAITQ